MSEYAVLTQEWLTPRRIATTTVLALSFLVLAKCGALTNPGHRGGPHPGPPSKAFVTDAPTLDADQLLTEHHRIILSPVQAS